MHIGHRKSAVIVVAAVARALALQWASACGRKLVALRLCQNLLDHHSY